MVRWRLMLKEWHLTIKHVAGVDNDSADALLWMDIRNKLSDVTNWENPFQNYPIVTER